MALYEIHVTVPQDPSRSGSYAVHAKHFMAAVNKLLKRFFRDIPDASSTIEFRKQRVQLN